jgi:hypothetical protein
MFLGNKIDMNAAFFVGLGVVAMSEILRALPVFVSGAQIHRVAWNIVTGFPSFVVLCFLSGVVADWIISQNENHTGSALFVFIIWLIAKCAEYILDNNGSLFRKQWESRKVISHRLYAKYLYVCLLIIVFCPYVCFHEYFSSSWEIPLLICSIPVCAAWLFFNDIWNYLWTSEEEYTRSEMSNIVRTYCMRSFVTIGSKEPEFIARAALDELQVMLRLTENSLEALNSFKAVHNTERAPGLAEIRLCNKHIEEIAICVQKDLMKELMCVRAMILIILGDENQFSENLDIASQLLKDKEDQIVELTKRREELKKDPSKRGLSLSLERC